MPTYEYRCTECEYEFEEFQSISDPPIVSCPSCQGKTNRIISGGAGLIFKGSGFYITDYRNSKYKADAAKAEKGITKPSDKSSSSDNKNKASDKSSTDKTSKKTNKP